LTPSPGTAQALVRAAPASSIHICQGLRANGMVAVAQRELAIRKLRQWIVMETVDDAGWRGHIRRLLYRKLLWQSRSRIEGVLAIGHRTGGWVVDRGLTTDRVFPFAYFLRDREVSKMTLADADTPFRFVFVGQIIHRKGLDLLVEALRRLADRKFELIVVGSGPLKAPLQSLTDAILPQRVHWLGRRPISEIPELVSQSDCLVLPSRHDGWGAVVSEALMAGTPAICSDACGAAGVVKASGRGGVFPSQDAAALVILLKQVLSEGRQTAVQRAQLADWGSCLGAESGAAYLDAILLRGTGGEPRPVPPWGHIDVSLTPQALP
jgi:glycosyltransferase involved in cell wall biosynthesis